MLAKAVVNSQIQLSNQWQMANKFNSLSGAADSDEPPDDSEPHKVRPVTSHYNIYIFDLRCLNGDRIPSKWPASGHKHEPVHLEIRGVG